MFFFDRQDHELLKMVNHILDSDLSEADARRKFFHHLHPRGIKEMSEIKGIRIAYAMVHLLGQLETGKAANRIKALRALFDEVMCSTEPMLRINAGRVLIEIMKELIRSRDNYDRQLQLAHDFQLVVSGGPRIIRWYLKQYHLLEMPEEWNQIAFDDHVHDANTKGRKSATHLIMDAWIKGIRRLRIIYYNFIRPETAQELMAAAEILGMHVRIGIEFSVSFYGRFVHFIWEPKGFGSTVNFLHFFSRDDVDSFMEDGGEVSEYQRKYVLVILEQFNRVHRECINAAFDVQLAEIQSKHFLDFVGIGQASLLHLAKFIHISLMPLLRDKLSSLRQEYARADEKGKRRIESLVSQMNQCDMDYILNHFLTPESNPQVPEAGRADLENLPELMKCSLPELIDRLETLHSGYRITLSLAQLEAEDVLELLYDCGGRISRLEIFSLKEYANGNVGHIPAIHQLQQAINAGNIIKLKQITLEIMERLSRNEDDVSLKRVEKFRHILSDMESLKRMYQIHPLRPRIGSNSTGHSPRMYGMGLAVMDSLPKRSQKRLYQKTSTSNVLRLPFHMDTSFRINYIFSWQEKGIWSSIFKGIRHIPGFRFFGLQKIREWILDTNSIRMVDSGNIVTLGGVQKSFTNGLCLSAECPEKNVKESGKSWKNLHSGWKNFCKVLIGFIPAFLTFFFTNDWWVLSYFGACIWFGITGFRNISQSVMGGGGMRRSSLLKWNDFVNWNRLCDSLMYTGFSVPLLDLLVKNMILARGFSITVSSHPLLLFSIMALVNGVYLTSHNVLRGLPKEAAIGNFFRSVLSIPVAFGINSLLAVSLGLMGMEGVGIFLQSWAAVISKLASDCVAGFIEGSADRSVNIRNRVLDYRQKLGQFQDVYSQLEIQFPDQEVYKLLDHPKEWFAQASSRGRDTMTILIINSLDMLYFWMYQPRARTAFINILEEMPEEERRIFLKAQNILTMNREISQMFIDGIAGRNFSQPLAFYLARYEEYLNVLAKHFPDSSYNGHGLTGYGIL